MSQALQQLSQRARQALAASNWSLVGQCANQIIAQNPESAEGFFLRGLCLVSAKQYGQAMGDFDRAIGFDPARYDAAIELASLHWQMGQHAAAKNKIDANVDKLGSSPKYLFKAAETYSKLGLHNDAWPLYDLADKQQPNAPVIVAALASCATKVGKVERAIELFDHLLENNPNHQRNHYERSRLTTAKDDVRIETMQAVIANSTRPAKENIFINYALGKELEDRERWADAFLHYQMGANAAHEQCLAAGYKVAQDIAVLKNIQTVCTSDWIEARSGLPDDTSQGAQPIFVVGLPRSGTTLVEKVISAHSQVETADESFFIELAIKRASKLRSIREVTASVIERAAKNSKADIAVDYLQAIAYRLEGSQFFVEKYPFNFLYVGFIRKYFPNAKIVLLKRNPMDVCFAMYKQPFFKFSYSQADLVQYHKAYSALIQHWSESVKDIVEVQYEELVGEPQQQVELLLSKLGLSFEQACVDYHENVTTSATASSVQVREKPHTRSVGKWQRWSKELQVLSDGLVNT